MEDKDKELEVIDPENQEPETVAQENPETETVVQENPETETVAQENQEPENPEPETAETDGLNLEDIIKEFGEADDIPTEKTAEEILQAAVAAAAQETAGETAPQQEQSQEQNGSTMRFAPVGEKSAPAVTSDTVRLDTLPEGTGVVRTADPIAEEQEEEKTEPFSEGWEPEYEQPIAEYVPAPPIVFKPKSRLRELKRKLVNGPEKQYYLQLEQGFGKLQAAIFFSFLVVLLSAGATVLDKIGFVGENRLRLMVFCQFFAMLLSALLGCYQLLDGVIDLFRGRFSLNTLLVFTFALCCADGVMCLQQQRIPCCAAFSLQVTMSLWSTYQQRTTRLGQLDTMRKATRLDGITAAAEYHDQRKGLLRGEGEVEHFMDTYEDRPHRTRTMTVYTIIALLVSIGAGAMGVVLHGVSTGIQVASVTLLAAMPASMFIISSRPRAVLEHRLHRVGATLCGWQSLKGLTGKALFPIDHNDLFPVGSVKMNGVKFFGSRQPDQVISYAAAVVAEGGGTLEPLFTHLLESRNGIRYPLKNFNRYDGGIGGEVCGEPVLVGTLTCLKAMGVEVPEGIRVNQAVYVAVDGELAGLFAVTYTKDRSAVTGLVTLCSYRKLKPVLISSDFMLTPEFIRSQFNINPKRILFPDFEVRSQLQAVEKDPDMPSLALITGEGLAPFGYAVAGARSLRTSVNWGVTIHLIGGILGMLIMLALTFLGATHLLTPSNLFLYELIWLIPGFLVTEMTRNL